MITFDKSISPLIYIGVAALSLLIISGGIYKYKQSVKKEQLVEINQDTKKSENSEIKKDENIKKHVANKPLNNVVDSLQSECRDCGEQGIRVQSPVNYQIIPQGQFDGGFSTSNRYSEPDSQTQMPGINSDNPCVGIEDCQ